MPHDADASPSAVEEVRPPTAPGAAGWDDFVTLLTDCGFLLPGRE